MSRIHVSRVSMARISLSRISVQNAALVSPRAQTKKWISECNFASLQLTFPCRPVTSFSVVVVSNPSEVVTIGSIIIFHLSKLWKAKFSILCDVIFLVRLKGKFDIDHSWVRVRVSLLETAQRIPSFVAAKMIWTGEKDGWLGWRGVLIYFFDVPSTTRELHVRRRYVFLAEQWEGRLWLDFYGKRNRQLRNGTIGWLQWKW